MVFVGQELRDVLDRSESAIELRNQYGRPYGLVSKNEALALNLDFFVGIGNRRAFDSCANAFGDFRLMPGSKPRGVSQISLA